MNKVVNDGVVYFKDDNNKDIMSIGFLSDECVWQFFSSDIVSVSKDNELFSLLEELMQQQYIFYNEDLIDYKDDNKLVWYSDCYYDPDDEWSINSVSFLTIEKNDNSFLIYVTKPLDSVIKRVSKYHSIAFSPLGNGKTNRNIETGMTLQDDFVNIIFHSLIDNRILKK